MKNANRMAAVIVALLSANCVCAQDWPQWRGPNRDAKATGFKAPATWPKELTKKWKVTVGGGDASQALAGDKLYVFTRVDPDEVIRCLDAATGKEIWQAKYEASPATTPGGKPHEGPRSTPAVAEGKVVTLGVRGKLSCYDAATGKKLWQKEEIQGYPKFYTASSPIIVDGLCIAQLGGSSNGALVAYDLATGNEKWKWTGDSPAYASPVLMTIDGAKLIVAETSRKIVAVNVASGRLAWEAACSTRYNAATPVVDGHAVIYGGGDLLKVEKEGDGFAAKEQWKNGENAVIYNTPVVKDGLVFGLSQGHKFFCLREQDGKVLWTAPASETAAAAPPAGGAPGGQGGQGGRRGRGGMMGGGSGYGSIVDAGPVLVALTPSQRLIVFEPSDKEFKKLADYKVADTQTFTYPVLSGNRIFIKDQDSVTLWTVE
jgi:outer membrane protein assembly factor BamB